MKLWHTLKQGWEKLCKRKNTKSEAPREKKFVGVFGLFVLAVLLFLGVSDMIYNGNLLFLTFWWIVFLGMLQTRRFLPKRLLRRIASRRLPYRRRLRALHLRRLRGTSLPVLSSEQVLCKNCGTSYQGNYCNLCGQTSETYRYNWRVMVSDLFKGFFNVDKGFGRTLLDLMYRPGYMMRQYIAGKRVDFFRPLQLLFVLSALYLIGLQIMVPNAETEQNKQDGLLSLKITQVPDSIVSRDSLNVETYPKELSRKYHLVLQTWEDWSTDFPVMGNVAQLLKTWWEQNKALRIIMVLPLFSFVAYRVFRNKKRPLRNYNLTEHFIIQTYVACQLLLLNLLLLPFVGNQYFDVHNSSLGFFFFCYNNTQLFGLNWLQSLKKTVVMFLYCWLIVALLVLLVAVLFVLFSL